jgi:15-cis-phytoene synthase
VSRDTSFSYSFLVLPADQRRAIGVVWDFCRAVDDAVDEEPVMERAVSRLADWQAEVGRLFAGTPVTPQGLQLQPYVQRFSLSREPLDLLVEGVEMDVHRQRYDTFEELVEYCRRVASAVGLICMEIFGCRGPEGREYATNLGLALQLTNIIRDVKDDRGKGRVYLPVEDLRRFGVGEADLAAERPTDAVRALLRFECARARHYYERAAAALPPSCAQALVAAEIMGGIYYEILRRIEERDYDVFSGRVRVPKPVRAMIALGVWTRRGLGFAGMRLGPAPRS